MHQCLTFSTAPSLGDTVLELSSGALYVGFFDLSKNRNEGSITLHNQLKHANSHRHATSLNIDFHTSPNMS
jgi:hypothetical protein